MAKAEMMFTPWCTYSKKKKGHVLLGEGSGKIWKKDNFIMINEFKYGQTREICPSPLNVSLYETVKGCI